MYWSFVTAAPAVEVVWMGDDDVVPEIGHRTNPVLGADLVFSLVDGRCTARLQGPVTQRRTYPHSRGAEYVGVRFRPGSGASTVGAGLRELQNDWTEVHCFDRINLDRLGEQLLGFETLAERGEAVAALFRTTPAALWAPNGLVTEALARFASGSARIATVADGLGVSERALQRCFAQHLGISPKHAARLVRVQRLVERLGVEPTSDLSVIAIDAGFFDQAHMTNEVSRVLAATPAALVDERRQRNADIESR